MYCLIGKDFIHILKMIVHFLLKGLFMKVKVERHAYEYKQLSVGGVLY